MTVAAKPKLENSTDQDIATENNEDFGIVLFCKAQRQACPKPVRIGEISGQSVFGCPQIIGKLKNGGAQDIKIAKYAPTAPNEPLDEKTIKGFYRCIARILGMLDDENAPQVAEKVLLKLIGVSKISETLAKEKKINPEELRNLRYTIETKLKNIDGRKNPSNRPVLSQKRVGDYIYKQQKSPRGGLYWYLLELKDKRNKLHYLGKEEPLFNPEKDLEILQEKQARKAQSETI